MRLLPIVLSLLIASCATNSKNEKRDGDSPEDSKAGGDDPYVSGGYVTFTYSLSNNGLTSFTVNSGKAKSLGDDIESSTANPSGKDRKDMIALMAAKRLAGEGVVPVFRVAKKLMLVEMKEDIRREMPEVAMLELALASIHSRQIPMAEHWIEKLSRSKNSKTKAAALTAKGMIALQDGRLPEAVAFWNDALAMQRDYAPARLNIGFTALRFGDYKTAKAMFSGMEQDWFIQTGMMQAERLADGSREAAALCASISEKKPNYKPAMFSCALNEYQGLGNLSKARDQLEKLAKSTSGPAAVDERIFLTLGRVDKEIKAQQQQKDAAAKASNAKSAPAPTAAPAAAAPASAPPSNPGKPGTPAP